MVPVIQKNMASADRTPAASERPSVQVSPARWFFASPGSQGERNEAIEKAASRSSFFDGGGHPPPTDKRGALMRKVPRQRPLAASPRVSFDPKPALAIDSRCLRPFLPDGATGGGRAS